MAILHWLFIIGTVQGCTIVIKNHGTRLRESTKYWEQVGYTLTTCEAACESDALCFGYFFDSDDGTCMKSAYTLAKNANNCPTCSFHSKRCGSDCSLTYTIYTSDKTSSNPYSVSAKSYSECEASCSSDQNCVGFAYESLISICLLTEYNIVEATADPCATCSLSIKVCNGILGSDTTTPNAIIELTTLTSVVTTLSDISTTPDVILTTETTTASNTNIETSTSIFSSMQDTTTNDQITTFTSPESTTTNQDITSDIITTTSETTFTYTDISSDMTTMTTESPPWDKYITSDIITTSESTAPAISSEITNTTISTGCTIVIKHHGTHLRESTSYWNALGYTLTTCEATCGSDAFCFGYSFDSYDGLCTKSSKTVSKNANNCLTCSFYSKRCGLDCSLAYTIYTSDKTSSNPYSVSAKSYPECEASCSSDQNCVGFGYDSSNNQCTLTEYNVVEVAAYPCATCSLSIKVCNGSLGSETTTQNVITELTTLTNVVTTLNDISTTTDVIQTTETTTASNTDIETSTSIFSSMEDRTTNNQITTFTSPESTTTNQDITSDIITTTSETTFTYTDISSDMTTMTTESPPWDKYITSDIITTTSESTAPATSSELTITTISNETKLPAAKLTSTVETTTNPDSISSMSIYFTVYNNIKSSSTFCPCHCVYDNSTSLQRRIEERKNTLKMNKHGLSSFHRRLNCAYDPRDSSKVVGGVGILVLILIMSLIIIPDIITSASRLTRKKAALVKKIHVCSI